MKRTVDPLPATARDSGPRSDQNNEILSIRWSIRSPTGTCRRRLHYFPSIDSHTSASGSAASPNLSKVTPTLRIIERKRRQNCRLGLPR